MDPESEGRLAVTCLRLDGNNHAPLDGLPVLDGVFPKLAPLEKHMDRHGEGKIPALDMHSPLTNFVMGNIFDKGWQRHTLTPTGCDKQRASGLHPFRLIQPQNETGRGFAPNGSSLSQRGTV